MRSSRAGWTGDHHERVAASLPPAGPTDRVFGLAGCAIFVAVGLLFYLRGGQVKGSIFGVGAILGVFALITPRVLSPLNRAGLALIHLLYRLLSPVVVAIRYAVTILPGALAMRLRRQDPLTGRPDRQSATYWAPRATNQTGLTDDP